MMNYEIVLSLFLSRLSDSGPGDTDVLSVAILWRNVVGLATLFYGSRRTERESVRARPAAVAAQRPPLVEFVGRLRTLRRDL